MEVTITSKNFEQEVKNSTTPVLLDFWASWCPPCQMLGPVLAEVAKEYAGKVKVGKVNVDEERDLADKFDVSSIPLLVVVKDGKVVKQAVGYHSKEQLKALIS